ncbi:MAG: hypothetical protein HY556_05880 [Euryarchaeota archaeon]|nr:hypothetical protein [Euryarchaeota archaeon]
MSADPVAVSLLDKARRSTDDLEARLLLTAALQRIADSLGLQLVVVGGTAVDFYAAGAAGTSAGYPKKWQASRDVDLVALSLRASSASENQLRRRLEAELGIDPEPFAPDDDGRVSYRRGLTVPDFQHGVEIVANELRGDPKAERVFTVEIESQPVVLRGPEDVLVAYAESGWDLYDGRDWERALAVWRTMEQEMDVDYLRRRAIDRRMPGVLEEVIAQRPLPDRRERLR